MQPVWPDWTIFWCLGDFFKPKAAIFRPNCPQFYCESILGNFLIYIGWLLSQAFSGHSETCLWHQLQLQDYNYLFDRNQRQNVQLSRQQRQLLLESVQQPRLQRRNGQHHFRRTLETSLHANVGYEKRYLLMMMMMTISAEAETMSRAHVFENIFASVKNKSRMYVNSVTRLGYFRKVMVNNSLPN